MMLDLFLSPFDGFEPADFEAYQQKCWSSNLHNRQRMKVRDKLSAIGHAVRDALSDAGHQLSYAINDFRPNVFNGRRVDAQWLFFTRTEDEKKKLFAALDREKSIAENFSDPAHHKRHIILGLKVHEGGVDLMLGIHRNARFDARNGASRLDDEWQQERIVDLFTEVAAASPCALALGFDGSPLSALTGVEVFRALDGVAKGDEDWFVLGHRCAADDGQLASATFKTQVVGVFLALVPLFNYLAWSSENDHLALKETLKAERASLRSAGSEELEPGTRVAITAGLFSGKQGVVQEVDRKGMAKVGVGKMVIQIKLKALKPL